MANTSYRYLCLLLLPLFVLVANSCERPTLKKRILVIQSYEPDFHAYKDIENTLKKELQKEGIRSSIFTFYLNCEAYRATQEIQRMYTELDNLSSWKPDIIIVNDDQATYSLLACEHPLLDSIPIVFTGVNYPNRPLIQKYPNVSGFWDKPDYRKNIELIEQIMGKCVIVRISDSTILDKWILKDMNEQIKGLCSITRPKYSNYPTHSSPANQKTSPSSLRSAKIPFDSLHIQTVRPRTSSELIWGLGTSTYNKAYLATKRDYISISLGRFCSFPSFSTINESVGYGGGFIGGYMTPVETQTQEASRRAVDILKGTPANSFPQITESTKNYLFDYPTSTEWGINWKELPKGSIFLNMPFMVRYQTYIILCGILLTLFILWTFFYQRIQYRREAAHKKQAQESLQKEKEFLSLALEGGNIFAFRYSNSLFEFDHDFYKSLNIPIKPITSMQLLESLHPDDREDFILHKHQLDTGFPSRKITRRRYKFNGKGYIWWEFRYAQAKERHGVTRENLGVSGLCLNIQQSKEVEEDLIKARIKAEEADQMKSAFLANMSHEIRTPLNAIVGFSELLTSGMEISPEEREEFMQVISKNSDLLLKLINDILDLSRIESGKMSFTLTNCDLNELLSHVYRTHQLLMPKDVELKMQLPAIPAILQTDRHRLTQVVTNLINNAAKFTARGHILIKYDYTPDKRWIRLSVTDTGKGIPADKQAQIFERFNKLDEFAQGTGLGLVICQIIIEHFGGHITLESKEGEGSTFIVTLPYTAGLSV
ncbi:MAG: sensor histidine kinase [Parabacteroides sp.]|nr:sensor histidine kinase [Parabacteroides sp.]